MILYLYPQHLGTKGELRIGKQECRRHAVPTVYSFKAIAAYSTGLAMHAPNKHHFQRIKANMLQTFLNYILTGNHPEIENL